MSRGFVLQPTWRAERGVPVVRLWGRLEDGRPFLVRDDRTRPRFWIAARDAERAAALSARLVPEEPPRHDLHGRPVACVQTAKPSDVPALRDRLTEAGIRTHEADVRFAYRYLIERGIRGTLEIDGDARDEGGVAVFDNPDVRPADARPELTVLSIDIETDPRARQLLSVALVGCGASDVLLLTGAGQSCPGDAIPFPSEADLLRGLVRRVRELDPDIVTGWNVIDFDLFVLARLASQHGVPLPIGRGNEPMRLRPSRAPGNQHEATIPGRVVLDGIQLVRGAFLRYESYSLENVSREVLGEGKSMHGPDRAGAILDAFRRDRQGFVEYNRRDAQLVLDILDQLKLLDLAAERSRLTGMPLDRVAASIASFDFLYLTELGRRRFVAPSVEDADRSMPQAGGTVLEATPGLHRFVLVMDFLSLYPSLIRTFRIDPLGRLELARVEREEGPRDDAIVAPNGARFPREGGILPGLLAELMPRRAEAKARGDAVASQAIKILMNSFYGVLGTPACRFAASDLANAITGFGRAMLLWTRDRVREKGHRVLYGDTDSLFVESGAEDAASARATGEKLVAELNAELAEYVRATWGVDSLLTLELEKVFLRLFLPPLRGGTAGAAKRYVGLEAGRPEPRVVFTGMEVVRRDWTELAKRVQRELYRRLFAEESPEEYLARVVAEVRSGAQDEWLVYRKGLRKKLESYTSSVPPHVAAARKLPGRPPSVIEYVITTNGPEPRADVRSPIDREHYVQRQVRPVAEPVLAELGLEFDVVVGDDRQMALF
ncbi:DNA polymerase II [bacterium]|nr:DNA polymerase II [bacterium]